MAPTAHSWVPRSGPGWCAPSDATCGVSADAQWRCIYRMAESGCADAPIRSRWRRIEGRSWGNRNSPIETYGHEREDRRRDRDVGHEIVDCAINRTEWPIWVQHEYKVEDAVQRRHQQVGDAQVQQEVICDRPHAAMSCRDIWRKKSRGLEEKKTRGNEKMGDGKADTWWPRQRMLEIRGKAIANAAYTCFCKVL